MVFGDSDIVPRSLTGGSRAATMAGGATLTTARALKAKVLEAASHLFEASPADLDSRRVLSPSSASRLGPCPWPSS